MNNSSRIVRWGIYLNIFLVLLKGISGWYGHSEALLADALESGGDILSSTLVLLGVMYASRPPDKNHPYGHGRAEALLTILLVLFLVTSAGVMIYRNISALYLPHPAPEMFTLWILGVTIVVKEVFFRIAGNVAKQESSTLVQSDAFHHRSDAITSLAALVGVTLAVLLGEKFVYADNYAALFACAIILYNAYKLLRPALGELMDEDTFGEMISEMRSVAMTIEGVVSTEKCHVRKNGASYFVDMHINVDPEISVAKGHSIAHKVQDAIREKLPGVASVLIHVEPSGS